jgi:hypothetical protein
LLNIGTQFEDQRTNTYQQIHRTHKHQGSLWLVVERAGCACVSSTSSSWRAATAAVLFAARATSSALPRSALARPPALLDLAAVAL